MMVSENLYSYKQRIQENFPASGSLIMLKFRLFGLLMVVTFTSAQDGIVGRRVPSFIGTRGKKSQIDYEKEVPGFDFDASSSSSLSSSKLIDNVDELRYNPDKRTRLGFQGTRGKKLYSDFPYKKNVGFMGTRGKKDDMYSYPKMDDLEAYWLLRNELAKRKFYGMRGKKLPYSFNVMGVRGKKGPSNTAFIGMRGKKDDSTVQLTKEDYNSAENLAALIYLLTTDKDYMRHHSGEDFDFEISDIDSQLSQDQQLPSNDVNNV